MVILTPNQKHELPPVLNIHQAAAYLQRTAKTIRRRIWAGEIKSYKEGKQHRIRREWILEYENRLIAASNE